MPRSYAAAVHVASSLLTRKVYLTCNFDGLIIQHMWHDAQQSSMIKSEHDNNVTAVNCDVYYSKSHAHNTLTPHTKAENTVEKVGLNRLR